MRLSVSTAAVAIIILLVSLCAGAAVIHIPADQSTIAAGLAAASAGDTLLLACQAFHEHGMFIDKPVTIASETGSPGCASIDGELADRIFWIENTSGVVFSGITLLNGQSAWGSAVYADSSDVTFDFCVFQGNRVSVEGGAAFYNRGTGAFIDCTFTANDAEYGGGGIVVNAADVTFTNCAFVGNEARWGGGVAIYHPGATPVFNWCDFQENRAVGEEPYGGGAYCWNYATPTFSHCNFIGNTSEYGGGGLMSDEECQLVVDHCTFDGNSARFGGGLETWRTRGGSVTNTNFTENTAESGGGVLHEDSQDVVFTDCAFEDNEATVAGGGFILSAASPGPSDCTFTGNSAAFGGGVAVEYCTAPLVSDCRFFGNTAQLGGAIAIDTCGSPAVTGCTIAENAALYGGGVGLSRCSTPSVSGSTIVVNRADAQGGGIAVTTGTTVSVERTIIGFSTAGEAIATDGCPVSCTTTAVYGNAGGDWVGIIAGQEGSNYNIATDPYLCGVLSGDYTLCEDSPCLPDNNGAGVLIGVYEDGCPGPCGSAVEARSWGSIKGMYR